MFWRVRSGEGERGALRPSAAFVTALTSAAFAGLLHSPSPLSAQEGSAELQGVVVAAETAEPLAGAVVELPLLEARTETNAEGRFRLRGLSPGVQALSVSYLGRASGYVLVELEPGEANRVELFVEAEPMEVPELRVEVERVRRGKIAGFHERMKRHGGGHFITREQIEATPGSDLHRVLRGIGGIRVARCPPPPGMAASPPDCYRIYSRRARPSFQGSREPCQPAYYLDGARVPLGDSPLGVNEIPLELVEGVEIYQGPATAPAQYGGIGARCGVVLLWTR